MFLLKISISLLVVMYVRVTAYLKDSELFPYLESSGSSLFYFGDDNYVGVNLQKNFQFLNINYSSVHLSGNGYITFGQGLGSTGYGCNKSHATIPTAAVYMSDADNSKDRDSAKLLYRQDTSYTSLNQISKDVFDAFPALEGAITLNWMFIVTWYNVPPFGTDKLHLRNTFQAVLVSDVTGQYSFFLTYYGKIMWPQLNDQTAARVGIFGGNTTDHFYLIPGSCTYSLLNIGNMSNFEQPGKFAFRVDKNVGLPSVPTCVNSNEARGVLNVAFTPNVVSIMGNEPLLVHNLNICLGSAVSSVICIFHGSRNHIKPQKVMGFQQRFKVFCQSPDFYYSLGKIKVDVQLRFSNGKQVLAFGYVTVVKMNSAKVSLEAAYGTNILPGIKLSAFWKLLAVRARAQDLENEMKSKNMKLPGPSSYLNLTLMELVDSTWRKVYSFDSTPNNGSWVHHITLHDAQTATTLISASVETPPRALTISTTFNLKNGKLLKLTCAADIIRTTMILAKLKTDQTSSSTNVYDKKCKQWHDHEPQPPVDVFPCPPTLKQASYDWRFSLESSSEISESTIMNPRNYTIYVQSVSSPSGAGSQCSYDDQGFLVIGYPYGSRIHRSSPNNWKHYWDYYWNDVMPYLQCCVLSYKKDENCRKFYFSKRPTNFDYIPPVPFRASGATHIAKYDGKAYLLDQIGTFLFLKFENQLEIQILTERYTNQNSTRYSSPVVITAAVIQFSTETNIQSKFQISANSSNGLLIWLDDEPLNFFYDAMFHINHDYYKQNWTLYHEGVNVLINGTSEAIFSFYNGLSVKFMITPGNKSMTVIGSVSSLLKEGSIPITGLLKDIDGNPEVLELWRIPKNESLFRFPTGKTYENYNNATIRPLRQQSRDDILNSISADIIAACGNVEDCQIDYLLTNDINFYKSSISAYKQFEMLLNASKINNDPVKCSKPGNIENGKFSGDFKIGASIEFLCDTGYYLNVTNNDNMLSENRFVCTPSTQITVESNMTSEGAIWVSPLHFQPLSNFIIECTSIRKDHAKLGKRMEARPRIITDMGIQSVDLTLPNEIDKLNIVDIICVFKSTSVKPADVVETRCSFLTEPNQNPTIVTCPTPILQALGKINTRLVINYLNKPSILFETQVWFENPSQDDTKLAIQFYSGEENLTFLWEPSVFTMNDDSTLPMSCNLNLLIIQPVAKFWQAIGIVDSEICNTGSYEVSVESVFTSLASISNYDMFSKPTALVLTVPEYHTFATSGLLSSVVMLHDVIMTGAITDSTTQNTDLSEKLDIPGIPDFDLLCSQWYQHESNDLKNAKGTLACPRSATLAGIDSRFREIIQDSWPILNSNAAVLFVGSVTLENSQGGVVQCAYNDDGELMMGSPTGSYAYRYNPNSWNNGWWNHYTHDTLPYLYCCKWSTREDNCRAYFYEKRGVPFNGNYDSPKFAHVWGAGHFHTFDGLGYRFNGAGEFWMIKSEAERKWNELSKFACQVRLEPYTKAVEDQGIDSQQSKVSVISAVAMSEIINDEKIIIEVFRNVSAGFYVLVNRDLVDNEDINSLYYENVNLFFNRTCSELLVVFQYGFSFKFTISGKGEPGMNMIVSAAFDMNQKSVTGLLGNLDGDSSNDLANPLGTILPRNSSIESIHIWFGMQWIVHRNELLFSNEKSLDDLSTSGSQVISIALLPQHSTFPVEKIREICEQDSDCMFDALATGSEAFTVAGRLSQEAFQGILNITFAELAPECVYIENEGQDGLQKFNVGSKVQVACYATGITEENVTFTCMELEKGLLEWVSVDSPDLNLNTCLSVGNPKESGSFSAVEDEDTHTHQIFSNIPVIILSATTLVLLIAVVALTLHVIVRRKYSALDALRGQSMANNLLELNDFN